MKYLLITLAVWLPVVLSAQDKVEREYRVRARLVPDTAQDWLKHTFSHTRRLKWYFEETSGKESYEAKFRHQKVRYSVEFSIDGVLEDIELERKLDQLAPAERTALEQAFNQIPQFRLHRMQEQWTGSLPKLVQAVQNADFSDVNRRFEIEFSGSLDDQHALWEGTFTAEGQLLSYRKILLRSTDNLDY